MRASTASGKFAEVRDEQEIVIIEGIPSVRFKVRSPSRVATRMMTPSKLIPSYEAPETDRFATLEDPSVLEKASINE